MSPRHAARYAVYYTPSPEHPLWHAGCDWLQRDPEADEARAPTRPHVAAPWRYGFHATLRPPFALAAGQAESGLIAALLALAQATPRFEMPALSVQWLAGFLALRPAEPLAAGHALHRLAERCITALDAWRAPLSPEALQRRLAAPLDARERELLVQHGYPHVLDRWRFHMTLSDTLPDDAALRREVEHAAQAHFAAALQAPLACEALSLFVEPAPGQPLQLRQRFPLS
ncbi:MAG: DUF1045 domain-containing protein [Rhizobacter sp.]|nr:DUF1045 domain-containing protein [Rhizobacter sp.]